MVYKSLAALCLVVACVCMAEDMVSPPACSDGVCVINVLSEALIVAPCSDDSVLVAYSQASGATLLQCSHPSDPEDNRTFVYDRNDAATKSYEFRGGRFIRPDYLSTAVSEGIPDKFGAVPLCAVKDRRIAATGELILADNQPGDSRGAPYCYRIHYVVAGKRSLQVLGDDGKALEPLSSAEIAVWARLREKLTPYIAKDGASAAPSSRFRRRWYRATKRDCSGLRMSPPEARCTSSKATRSRSWTAASSARVGAGFATSTSRERRSKPGCRRRTSIYRSNSCLRGHGRISSRVQELAPAACYLVPFG